MRTSPKNGNANVTSIVVNTNDTASFFNGTQLLRTYGTVRNIGPSEDRQYIVIEENSGSLFRFDVWRITSIGSDSFSPIDKYADDAQDQYNARYDELFALISERIFKGCCDCGGGTDTSFLPTYEYNSLIDSGQYYYASGTLFMSPFGLSAQDFGDLLADLPDTSWISFFSTDSADYVVYEVSSYSLISGVAAFTATIVSGNSTGFAEGSTYTVLFDKADVPSSGVETVTGTAVTGTPTNPIIDFTPWNDLTGAPEDNEDLVNRVQNSEWVFGSTTGTDTYAVNFAPALTALQLGQWFLVRFVNGNTGPSTLNPNSLGATNLYKNVSTALVSGDIPAGAILPGMCDGPIYQVELMFAGNPTLKELLLAGATMTQNNTVAGAGFRFTWDNFQRFVVNTTQRIALESASGSDYIDFQLYPTGFGSTVGDGVNNSSLLQNSTRFWIERAVLDEHQAANLASAATTNLAQLIGNSVTITGSVTIIAFGTADAGARRMVTFAGILTLTHNATSLILPTGANILTAAGDTCIAISLGSGNWKVFDYTRASGQALVASLPDLVVTKYAPALDQIIPDGYSAYYSGYYEIADTKFLEIGIGSTLEIG